MKPLYETISKWQEPVCIALLPDHPTPVEIRTHVKEPVPFVIWHPNILPDNVSTYDEVSCREGGYGMLSLQQLMETFMKIQ